MSQSCRSFSVILTFTALRFEASREKVMTCLNDLLVTGAYHEVDCSTDRHTGQKMKFCRYKHGLQVHLWPLRLHVFQTSFSMSDLMTVVGLIISLGSDLNTPRDRVTCTSNETFTNYEPTEANCTVRYGGGRFWVSS